MWFFYCWVSGEVVRWLTHTPDCEGSIPTYVTFDGLLYIYKFILFFIPWFFVFHHNGNNTCCISSTVHTRCFCAATVVWISRYLCANAKNNDFLYRPYCQARDQTFCLGLHLCLYCEFAISIEISGTSPFMGHNMRFPTIWHFDKCRFACAASFKA